MNARIKPWGRALVIIGAALAAVSLGGCVYYPSTYGYGYGYGYPGYVAPAYVAPPVTGSIVIGGGWWGGGWGDHDGWRGGWHH